MSQKKPDLSIYPIEANKEFLRRDDIATYVEFIFGCVDWQQGQFLVLRGIGEKGTVREGEFRADEPIQPSHGDPTDHIISIAERWAAYHVATFCVPCVLKSHAGTADNVELFTCLLADLDSGDTDEKIAWMTAHVGEPSMVVASGGKTDTGHTKRHVYYRLENPTRDVRRVVQLRDQLWRKCGGDPTMGLGVEGNEYGRAHQPVRIAGTVHAKGGHARSCSIETFSGKLYDLDEISAAIEAMPKGPFVPEEVAPEAALDPKNGLQTLFTPESGAERHPVDLNAPVYEGGEGRTRFSEFNRVCGHYIHSARMGEFTTAEALQRVKGWAAVNMVPPWPDARIEKEFQGLLDEDLRQAGPMPQPRAPLVPADAPEGLEVWAAHRWVTEPKPEHEFLVDGLVIKGEPHLFVAEGSSGKTFLIADLAMKIAAWQEGCDFEWCGQKVLSGGTAVLILFEDSQTEMHRRLVDLNAHKLIQKAGDNLIVLPMNSDALPGPFPLSTRGKDGTSTSSQLWNEMIGLLGRLKNLKFVAIDTMNSVSHGEENSSAIIAELMREAGRVRKELGAALMMTHHVRKSNGEPIKNLAELKDAVRGSTAITSYFRINVGMYRAPDYKRRLEAMGEKSDDPNRLWMFGNVKSNIGGIIDKVKTLLRNEHGLLQDVTGQDRYSDVNVRERIAWLVFAVDQAVKAGHPYKRGKSADGIYTRRSEMPPILRHIGEYEFKGLIESALQLGQLVTATAPGGKSKAYLDLPDGMLAKDEYGAAIQSGAYNSAPVWENYEYNDVDGTVQVLPHLAKPKIKPEPCKEAAGAMKPSM